MPWYVRRINKRLDDLRAMATNSTGYANTLTINGATVPVPTQPADNYSNQYGVQPAQYGAPQASALSTDPPPSYEQISGMKV